MENVFIAFKHILLVQKIRLSALFNLRQVEQKLKVSSNEPNDESTIQFRQVGSGNGVFLSQSPTTRHAGALLMASYYLMNGALNIVDGNKTRVIVSQLSGTERFKRLYYF